MKKQFQHLMLAIILIAASVTVQAQPPNWLTAGNTGANNFKLGTTNGFNLNVIANNKTRMIFEKATTNSSIEIGAGAPITNYGVHIYGGVGDVLSQGLYIQRADNGGTGVQDCSLAIGFSSNLFTSVATGGGTCGFVLFPSNGDIPDMAFSTNNVAPQMIIKNGGNVGINISSPLFKLDLTTTTANDACRLTQAGSSGSIGLQLNNTSANGRNWTLKSLGNGDVDGAGNFLISESNGSNTFDRFLVQNTTGNVGIGTVQPTAQLHVVTANQQYTAEFDNTTTAVNNVVGAHGSVNNTYSGGFQTLNYGVIGDATTVGGGDHRTIGVQGTGSGGNVNNGGIFVATGNGNITNYGIFAQATGASNDFNDWSGYFQGNVNITGNLYNNLTLIFSDIRFKQDIKPLGNVADKIQKLGSYTYKYRVNEFPDKYFDDSTHIGLIAQEVKQVFPELVRQDDKGYYAVNYVGMIPILLEAIKEQQKQFDAQKQVEDKQLQEINDLKSQLATVNARLDALEKAQGSSFDSKSMPGSLNSMMLEQNTPNPFSQSTTIRYSIPDGTQNAQLVITDLTGKILKTYSISPGAGQQVISGNELAAGSYMYSIRINGNVVSSRQMILTK